MLFTFVIKAVLMVPVVSVMLRYCRTFKKEGAYLSCFLLKITGFSVVSCVLLFSFAGILAYTSTNLSLILCAAVCMFVYSVFLDSGFLRRGAFIYGISSLICFAVPQIVFNKILYSMGDEYEAVARLSEISGWVFCGIIALAVVLGYLITMTGILRKNKELAREKADEAHKIDT